MKTPAPTNLTDATGYGENGSDAPGTANPGDRVLSGLASEIEETNADDTLASVRAGTLANNQVRDVGASTAPVHPAMADKGIG